MLQLLADFPECRRINISDRYRSQLQALDVRMRGYCHPGCWCQFNTAKVKTNQRWKYLDKVHGDCFNWVLETVIGLETDTQAAKVGVAFLVKGYELPIEPEVVYQVAMVVNVVQGRTGPTNL